MDGKELFSVNGYSDNFYNVFLTLSSEELITQARLTKENHLSANEIDEIVRVFMAK